MNLWNIVVPAVVLVLIVRRQLQPRPVREERPWRLLLALVVIGAVQVVQYAQDRQVPAAAWALLTASLVIGTGFGLLRGATVHIWRVDDVLTRQGNAVTVALWVVGLALHFGADALIGQTSHAARDLGSSALLLYVAVVLAAQRWATLQRAEQMEPTAPS